MEGVTMEAMWLNEKGSCSRLTLIEASGLSGEEVQWLVDSGALMPLAAPAPGQGHGQDIQFPAHALQVARLARRLRDDFELDSAGLALALRLMERIEALEQEAARLRARLPAGRRTP